MKKHKKLFIALAILLVALALGGVFIYFFLIRGAKKNDSILYVQDEKLMLFSGNNKESIVIDDNFSGDYLYAAFSEDGSYIAYMKESGLYVYNGFTKNNKQVAYDDDIYEFEFSSDSKYIAYIAENNVYSYDIAKDNKEKITSIGEDDEVQFIYNYSNKIYYEVHNTDDYLKNIYYYDFKTNKVEKIVANAKGFGIDEDVNKILYYIVDDDSNLQNIYTYDIKKNEEQKILSNVVNGYAIYGEDYSKILFLRESEEHPEIIIDDEKGNDPVTTVKEKRLCTYYEYLYNNCTFEQYLYDEYFYVTKQDSKKEMNDEIRDFVSNVKYYDLYLYDNGKESLIEKNVDYISHTNDDFNRYIFYRYNISEAKKISEFKSYEEFTNYYNSTYTLYFKNKNDDAVVVESNSNRFNHYQTFLTDDAVYYVNADDTELSYYNTSAKDAKVEKLVSADYITIIDDSKYGLLYEVTKEEKTNLYLFDGQEHEVVKNIYAAYYDEDTKKIVMYDNCNSYSCNYSEYDGNLKIIFEDVAGINKLDNNRYYIFKNYSSSNETYDLYYYDGKEQIKIAYDISEDLIYVNY